MKLVQSCLRLNSRATAAVFSVVTAEITLLDYDLPQIVSTAFVMNFFAVQVFALGLMVSFQLARKLHEFFLLFALAMGSYQLFALDLIR